jgi:hypothetical protein
VCVTSRNEGVTALKDEFALSPQITANRLLTDHFRCLGGLTDLAVTGDLSADSGYFRFGSAGICYGQCSSGTPATFVTDPLHDAGQYVSMNGYSVQLPFDPVQVVNNLHYERYRCNPAEGKKKINASSLVRKLYYLARPLMPVAVRKHLQRFYFRDWNKIPFPSWPVDFSVESILEQLLMLSMKSQNVERIPFIWFWPEGAPSCAIVTHDVETSAGRDFCHQLMDLNDSFEIKTAFQVVPEKRYSVPQSLLDCIGERGFELNVHDLNHDGHLMDHREEFLRRAKHINRYGLRFGARGFRSAMLHRNLDWYDALEFSYDMSVPNVAHLDPQRGGCCTVFPFFNGKLLELPITMTQDYTLFHILKDYSIDLWKEQISLIRQRHGLMQVIVHPDYIIDKAARGTYAELLGYLAELRTRGETWIALPSEVAVWWRLRSELRLVNEGGSLRIEGEGKQRARIAYATIVDERLTYEFDSSAGNAKDSSNHSRDVTEEMAFQRLLQTEP